MQKQSIITGGVLGLLAGALGIYLISGDERKASEIAPPAVHEGMGGGEAASLGVTRELATGTLAAFVVKADRPALAAVEMFDSKAAKRTLGEWRGRIVLVNLWATWCAPCKKEMPDLARLQQQLGSPDFEVVAISVDRKDPAASRAFLDANAASALALYTDPEALSLDRLQAIGLPVTVLVDRKGHEIGRLHGPADWASPEAITLIKAAIGEGKDKAASAAKP